MKIKTYKPKAVYFVQDDYGEIIAGPFLYQSEAAEWLEGNGGENKAISNTKIS